LDVAPRVVGLLMNVRISSAADVAEAAPHCAAGVVPPRMNPASLWYRRSVRVQLLVTFVAIGLAAALTAGSVTILQARKSTRVEIAASLRMAEVLVKEAAELLQQELPAERFLADLPAQLRFVRHLRINMRDASGAAVATRPSPDVALRPGEERSPAPAWFAALIAPPVSAREVPVMVKGQYVGSVMLTGEAGDEIAEVWENTVDLAIVSLLVGLTAIAALYVVIGRVLDPLVSLAGGLDDLERRNYQVRLARPNLRELAAITDRFNRVAQALDDMRAENARLHHRLITAQDDERRQTALDLHDEVGPSLFGLKANAGSIAKAAGEIDHPRAHALAERAREMLDIIAHLQAINRGILNRLRPMALGQVPLSDLISDLVRERAGQHPDIAFAFAPGRLAASYGDSVDLTVYRCVQEALTNAVRHAGAGRITIALAQKAARPEGAPALQLVVADDGCGMSPTAGFGRGLAGMQERVQALAGTCAIDSAPGRGMTLRITLPIASLGASAPSAMMDVQPCEAAS
jgi:two-component system, NarL family, sensor histidine kinase UhpB